MRSYTLLICIVLCLVSMVWAQQRCPNHCNYPHGQCMNDGTCSCQNNWRGIDCSISMRTLPTLPAEVSEDVNQGAFRYYSYFVPANTAHKLKMTIMIPPSARSADADLYVKKGGVLMPTRGNYDWAHTGTASVSVLEIPAQSGATTFIVGVYGYTTVAMFKLEVSLAGSVCPDDCSGHGTCVPATRTCQCTAGWHGTSCNQAVAIVPQGVKTERVERGAWSYYYLTVPSGTTAFNVSVSQVGIEGQTGDVDLYIKKGSVPAFSSFDYADSSTRQSFSINVPQPQSGATYYIGFYGYTATVFRWQVVMATSTSSCPNACSGTSHGRCTNNGVCACEPSFSNPDCSQMTRDLRTSAAGGETISGLVKQSEWNFYSATPDSASPLVITVRHAAGQDCDVYVQRNVNPTRFSFLYRDITYATETRLVIQNPLDTNWKIGVLGFSDCEYSITASIQGFVPTSPSSPPSQSPSCSPSCTANGGSCPPSNPSLCVCPATRGGPNCEFPVQAIRSGQTLEGTVAPNQWVFYRYDGPVSAFSIVLHEDQLPSSSAGVLWLYSSVVQAPSLTNYDWSDTATGTDTHRINVETGHLTSNGHYYIGVYGSPYAINPRNHFKIVTWSAPFKK